ncbi:hypothetical protein EST38_g4471 [Candolleomyces aberdarensis]|uniref:RING-type domain-containing protein n=1 Tax=Candolleomyces aberdarensis TaxID=2316362 RepID=A0A4Q2DQU8_9AGAR|nr:hypothetical protein EST38_g4471 [Candolleomyces aberdarensis]
MASASASDSNSSKDPQRSARSNGITTEYISFADLATSSGNALASAHTKENLRRLASGSKHAELSPPPSRLPSTESSEANPVPHPVRHGRRPGYLTYFPSNESQPPPPESRGNGAPAHSSHSSTRSPTLSHGQRHPTQPAAPFDRVKAKKENGKMVLAPQADIRHLRHSQSSHSSRSVNGAESPKWETDKGAYGDRLSMAGPIAAASWDHMQREVEMLRRTVQELTKSSKKQAKRIEELRTQSTSQHQIMQDKDREILSLGQKYSKLETFISTVENAIQCQICMDLPNRPYTLAPCGHVLCLTCLQEWFKTSPGVADDDEDEDVGDSILYREKTCPCCRTVVRHRPCPAFMVKAVTSAYLQDKGGTPPQTQDVPEPLDDDPWKGIFLNSDDDGDDDDDLYSDDDVVDDDDDVRDLAWMRDSPSLGYHYHWHTSDSEDGLYSDDGREEEEEEGVRDSESEDDYGAPVSYVLPRWEPPTVRAHPEDYPGVEEDVLSLLRRGCTLEMVQNFNIRYSHQQGIIISLRSIDHLYASDDDDEEDSGSEEGRGRESMHQIFLGWNVSLEPEDDDGETYMHNILKDIKDRPDRWKLIPRYDGQGSIEVKRLVAAGTADDYSTTETEAWIDMDEHDMDID